jgi:hypothetical protein
MRIDNITFIITVFFLPVWLVWELTLLWLRGSGYVSGDQLVRTISMVMRDRAYQFNVLPFFWSAMAAHWWANWLRTATYDSPAPAVAFWLLVAANLVLDLLLMSTPYYSLAPWLKVARAPMIQLALGFIAAYFLFPQRAPQGPWRWW